MLLAKSNSKPNLLAAVATQHLPDIVTAVVPDREWTVESEQRTSLDGYIY
jgi:hypothetical protein